MYVLFSYLATISMNALTTYILTNNNLSQLKSNTTNCSLWALKAPTSIKDEKMLVQEVQGFKTDPMDVAHVG